MDVSAAARLEREAMVFDLGVMPTDSGLGDGGLQGLGAVLGSCSSRRFGGAFFLGFLTRGVGDGDGRVGSDCVSSRTRSHLLARESGLRAAFDLGSGFCFLGVGLPDDESRASWKCLFFAAMRARASACLAFFSSAFAKGFASVLVVIALFV